MGDVSKGLSSPGSSPFQNVPGLGEPHRDLPPEQVDLSSPGSCWQQVRYSHCSLSAFLGSWTFLLGHAHVGLILPFPAVLDFSPSQPSFFHSASFKIEN